MQVGADNSVFAWKADGAIEVEHSKTYNFNFNLIESIMESLIGGGDEPIDVPFGRAYLLRIAPIRVSKYLASLHKLL